MLYNITLLLFVNHSNFLKTRTLDYLLLAKLEGENDKISGEKSIIYCLYWVPVKCKFLQVSDMGTTYFPLARLPK